VSKFIRASFIGLKLLVAYVFYIFNPKLKQDRITLVFGGFNGAFYQDNAYYLYLEASKLNDVNAYYICNDMVDSKFVKRDSWRAALLLIMAKWIYVSHSESDVISLIGRLLKHKTKFIQHGVIGIKKLADYEKQEYKGFLCSHEYEYSVLKKYYKTKENSIIKSLLPRYIMLEEESYQGNRDSIFVLLTWRDEGRFDVYNHIKAHEVILKCLSKHFTKITCCLHPAMLSYLSDECFDFFKNIENVVFVKSSEISSLIKSSDVFFTDYSSISWDFLYQGKPIIFYHEDFIEYNDKVGVYMNENDYFGKVIRYDNLIFFDKNKIIDEAVFKSEIFKGKYQFYKYDLYKILDIF